MGCLLGGYGNCAACTDRADRERESLNKLHELSDALKEIVEAEKSGKAVEGESN